MPGSGKTRTAKLAGNLSTALAALPKPSFIWDRDSLRKIGKSITGSAEGFVRDCWHQAPWAPPEWAGMHDGLQRTFRLDKGEHFLRADPIAWCNFTEPQITKGFTHFLNDGSHETRIGRVRALFAALSMDTAGGIADPAAIAEAPAAGNLRLDILITWKDENGQARALAIEAKFGHHLTTGQLPAYRREVRKHNASEDLSGYLYVLSRATSRDRDGKSLRRNRDWRWVSWKGLLLRYERNLAITEDDEAFRVFRRTVWNQI
jgi:hypothetical protein